MLVLVLLLLLLLVLVRVLVRVLVLVLVLNQSLLLFLLLTLTLMRTLQLHPPVTVGMWKTCYRWYVENMLRVKTEKTMPVQSWIGQTYPDPNARTSLLIPTTLVRPWYDPGTTLVPRSSRRTPRMLERTQRCHRSVR